MKLIFPFTTSRSPRAAALVAMLVTTAMGLAQPRAGSPPPDSVIGWEGLYGVTPETLERPAPSPPPSGQPEGEVARIRWLTLHGRITPGFPIHALVTYWDRENLFYKWNLAGLLKGAVAFPMPGGRLGRFLSPQTRHFTVVDLAEEEGEYRLMIPIGPTEAKEGTVEIRRVQLFLDWPPDYRMPVPTQGELLRLVEHLDDSEMTWPPDPRFPGGLGHEMKVSHAEIYNHGGGPLAWERLLWREVKHVSRYTRESYLQETLERMYFKFPAGSEDLAFELNIEVEE